MSSQNSNLQIPETPEDINRFIYTFLHVTNSDIFQLLHNETTADGYNPFQIYGCVRGALEDGGFRMEEIDLKLVNMAQVNNNEQFKIIDANMVANMDNPNLIDFFVTIEEVSQQTQGIDLTYKPSFLIKNCQKIDYHVGNPLTRNGRPCNNMVYF